MSSIMAKHVYKFLFTSILTATLTSAQGLSGSGQTTRYWDCCKPSCAWPNSLVTQSVQSCDINDQPLSDNNAQSACNGGTAFACSDQSPWAINDQLAYGFTAASLAGTGSGCCVCYKLTFTSSSIAGKQMIVQATNTGTDVGVTQFDLAMPGGGFGLFDACTTEWNAQSDVWGATYGGPDHDTCSQFPWQLQSGCEFRWDWMEGQSNPTVDYEVVTCPAEIVAKSGCQPIGNGYNTQARPAGAGTAPKPQESMHMDIQLSDGHSHMMPNYSQDPAGPPPGIPIVVQPNAVGAHPHAKPSGTGFATS